MHVHIHAAVMIGTETAKIAKQVGSAYTGF